MLADLVSAHQGRALDAYLLLLALEPILDADEPIEAAMWARLLDDEPRVAASVSRTWLQLERRGLITRERRKGHVHVLPRREDGKASYTRPGVRKSGARGADTTGGWPAKDWYFVLPHTYWERGLDQRLGLAAKAMLLVSLQATSTNATYWMRYEDAPKWYGLSEESVQRGLKQLRDEQLLVEHFQKIKSTRSATGLMTRTHYALAGEFSTAERHRLQTRTKRAVARSTARRPAAKGGDE
jgi:hypothetical protein